MLENTRRAFDVLREVPHDIYALLMIVIGSGLILAKQHDAGILVLGGGLSVFKGEK